MSGYVPGTGGMSGATIMCIVARTMVGPFGCWPYSMNLPGSACVLTWKGGDSESVLERLSDLLVRRGVPDHIRSDNGPEFTTERVRDWLRRVKVKTLFIEPGSPREYGYIDSFNGKLSDELLNGEIFDTFWEAKC